MFKKLLLVAIVAGAGLFAWSQLQSEPEEIAAGPSIAELAEQKLEENKGRLSAELISNADLPPEGTRSLFDYVVAEADGLPYPYEKLVEVVTKYDQGGKAPVQTLIPDGRSLLKAEADFSQPRVVLAADARLPESDYDYGLYLKSRLFLGFTEHANEIEVVSYNEEAGRFEFQLVKDYCEGCVPRIVYARRGICLTCHTGAGPIFSVRPWEETNAQPEIAKHIMEALNVDPAEASKAHYAGVPVAVKLSVPEAYDALTDIGNVIPTTQQIWIDGCGGDPVEGVECRREMLRLALQYLWNPGGLSPSPADHPKLMGLQAKAWPQGGIIQDNGNLQSRNPFAERDAPKGFFGLLREAVFGAKEHKTVVEMIGEAREKEGEVEGDAKLSAFENLPKLRPEVDPLTKREPIKVHSSNTLEGVFGVAQLFSPNDKRLLEKHSAYDFSKIEAALQDPGVDKVLQAGPFLRLDVMDALLTAMGVETLPNYCCRNAEGMSEPVVEGVPPLEITEGSILETFETYCFACHRGNPSARLNFMGAKTEAEVLEQIQAKSEIADALDYERYMGTRKESQLMPPDDSHQRELMDAAMAEGKDDLQKMAEVMPSMFDF